MTLIPELLSLSLSFAFCLSHSLLASQTLKELTPVNPQTYRILYVVVASVVFLVVTSLNLVLAVAPDHTEFSPLVLADAPISALINLLSVIGILIVAGSLLQTNPLKFAGIIPETLEKDLRIDFFYRWARHPMYFGALMMFLPGLVVSTNAVLLIQNLIFSLYFVFGAVAEERRMSKIMSGYAEYMSSRGFLFPWKPSHFKILFAKLTIGRS